MKKLLLLISCTLFFMAGAVAQTTHYVSKTGDNVENGGTSPADAWLTIQHAIDEAASGDIIIVGPGVYEEFLDIEKSITIEGIVDGEDRAVVRPVPEISEVAKRQIKSIITIPIGKLGSKADASPYVTISGLVIDGEGSPEANAGIISMSAVLKLDDIIIRNIKPSSMPIKIGRPNAYGIRVEGGELLLENSEIRDVHFEVPDKKSTGMHAVGVYNLGVHALRIKNNAIRGIHCDSGDASGISIHPPPYDEKLTGPGKEPFGLTKTEPQPDFEVSGNTIQDVLASNYAAGIFSRETDGLLIHGNTIKDIGGDYKALGIIIEWADLYYENKSFPEAEQAGGFMREKTGEVAENIEISGNTIERFFQGSAPSFGIHAYTPGRLFIHDNTISAIPPVGKMIYTGPEIGIFLIAEDVHLADNVFESCDIGVFTFFAANLHVEDNAFNEPMIGVLAIDFPLFARKELLRYDLPFELPAPPENMLAQKRMVMGSLKFTGNTFTGVPDGSYVGIAAMLFGEANKAEGPEMDPEPRFIAHGNLLENFRDGISLSLQEEGLAEISQGNIIQNNEFGVYVLGGGSLKKEGEPSKGLLSPVLAHINHNIIQGNAVGVANGYYYYDDGGDDNGNDNGFFKKVEFTPLVDATFNYWGREEGPGFVGVSDRKVGLPGNGVSAGVLYSPWLGFHPDTPPGEMTYYVDETGSIQDAIDMASAGDIIRILGGEYAGHIIVGQGDGLTLYPGDSPACVIIDGDLTAASGNTLLIDIEGLTPLCFASERKRLDSGGYTQVFVTGTANLNGITLELNMGYAPQIGDELAILYSLEEIQGTFSQGSSITVEHEGTMYTFDILYNVVEGGQVAKDNGPYYVVLELVQMDAPVAVPLSGWAIALGMLLMAGFVAYRFRF